MGFAVTQRGTASNRYAILAHIGNPSSPITKAAIAAVSNQSGSVALHAQGYNGGTAAEFIGGVDISGKIDISGDTNLNGAVHVNVKRTSSTNYTCSSTDCFIVCTYNNHITLNLPSSPLAGRKIYLAHDYNRDFYVNGNGRNIKYRGNTDTTITLGNVNQPGAVLIYDGYVWHVISDIW
jgi:hypothetical protein